jgi:hypothetical protein
MANQIVVSSGAKVRNLNDVIIGTSGVLSSLAFNVANGVPKLDVNGKILVSQLPNSVMEYQGTWNAATNTPTLVNGTGNQGDVYLCNVAGTVNFGAGPIAFVVGDQVIYSGTIWQRASGSTGTVTSVAVTESGDSLNITGSPITTSGTINIGFNGTNLQYINGAGDLTTFPTLLSSVGLSMPSAFNVSNSPLTANGTIGVTGAGVASQYIRGDGTLADFPTSGGGGGSVSYYLNGGTSQGVIGGITYYEMSKIAVIGIGVDFPKTGNGLIVSFLTDAGDPAQLNIPAGNWNFEIYASMSANGGTPQLYAELYVYDGTTFTLIGTSTNEILYDGTTLNLYTFAMAVPATTLAITDRLAVKLYATNSGGKTTTVHTQDGHLCQIITTFSTGITALNGLTAQVQFFATGTSGTDFAISSSTATHTFNLPIASALNTGKLSSTDWSTFNNKQATITLTTTGTSGAATLVGSTLNIPNYTTDLSGYVTLATTQTITGQKTFSLDILVNGLTIGTGAGSIGTNTAIGKYALFVNTTGYGNTSVGNNALGYNTTGFFNVAIGVNALLLNTIGTYNNAFGTASLYNNTTGSYNTAVGQQAGTGNTTGSNNTYIGIASGASIITGSNNTIIGNYSGTTAMANNIVLADGAGNVRYQFDGTNNIFANKVNFSSTIGNGTYTYTLPSANGTLALVGGAGVGTVTSVAALTLGTTGTDLSSTVANSTTTPVITLNVPTASATNRGALSSADWTTFNNKASTADLSNYVTLATSQTISGEKSFTSLSKTAFTSGIIISNTASGGAASGHTTIGANVSGLQVNLAGGGYNNLNFASTTVGNTYTFPNATGTIALTSDIPSGIITGTGTTNTHAKFTSASVIGNSMVSDDGTTLTSTGATRSNLYIRAANNSHYGQLAFTNGTNASTGGISYNNASQYMQFETATSEWMRLGSTGNLLIGTTTDSGYKLDVSGTGRFTSSLTAGSTTLTGSSSTMLFINTTNALGSASVHQQSGTNIGWVGNGASSVIGGSTSDFGINSQGKLFLATGGYERMSISSLGVATFQNGILCTASLQSLGTGAILLTQARDLSLSYGFYAPNNSIMYFWNSVDGGIGTFARTTGVYTALSDINKKKDFEASTIGLNEVLQLKPTLYRMKADDESEPKQLGFLAQEVQPFIPQAYVESFIEGEDKFIGLNYNAITATLVKAIQEMNTKSEEQQALITSLQEQINELKNK